MTPPPPPPPPLLDDFLHQGTSFSVTINIFNFFLVLILAGVTSFSRLIWVSLVVTFAGILANGFSHGANEISLVAHGPDRNMTQGILSFMIFLVSHSLAIQSRRISTSECLLSDLPGTRSRPLFLQLFHPSSNPTQKAADHLPSRLLDYFHDHSRHSVDDGN